MARRMEVLPAPVAPVTSRERPFLTCMQTSVSTCSLLMLLTFAASEHMQAGCMSQS